MLHAKKQSSLGGNGYR